MLSLAGCIPVFLAKSFHPNTLKCTREGILPVYASIGVTSSASWVRLLTRYHEYRSAQLQHADDSPAAESWHIIIWDDVWCDLSALAFWNDASEPVVSTR